jgi:hypothetical protein
LSVVGKLLEDPTHGRRLEFVDRAVPRLLAGDDVVAIGLAARNFALQSATKLTTPCLLAQVREEQLCHGAEQADVHRRDLAAGRDRVELDPGEAQPIVQIGNVGELAAEAVEGLDHDDVEATERHVRQQLLVARPKAAGAAHRAIFVGAD